MPSTEETSFDLDVVFTSPHLRANLEEKT